VNYLFFPNPTTDKLVFCGIFKEYLGNVNVTLFSSTGQFIYKKELQVNGMSVQENIEMNGLNAGLYFVNVQFENGPVINRKIIKK
jgi:hypothetical protein